MDKLASLGEQLSQVTMYDIKSYYNQAKNMVLNVPEMEAKVLEATNDDAWGASSSLMQEIAQGTFNFQAFNEIMPPIYKRFMEKEAREWRQIYKALVLLEYLVKNGSERVVDDARSHMSTVKMLRNFHYIDEKGKDQGINVRNRAKEIAELLSDVEKIRTERRKAKANRSKYTGVGSDGLRFSSGSGGFSGGGGLGGPLSGASFQTNSGSRYGGFGSDSLGGGGGGGYPGESHRSSSSGARAGGSSFNDARSTRPDNFEEYDAGDDEDLGSASATRAQASTGTSRVSVQAKGKQQQAKSQESVKAVDLFDFGDDDVPAAAPAPAAVPPSTLDDDFDDFQSAPSAPIAATPKAAPAPAASPAKAADLFDFFDSAPPAATAPAVPSAALAFQPPTYAAPKQPAYTPTGSYSSPSAAPALAPVQQQQPAKPASGFGGFDDLWSASLGSLGKSAPPKTGAGASSGKSMAQIEQEKRRESLWGASSGAAPAAAGQGAPAGGAPKQATMSEDFLL